MNAEVNKKIYRGVPLIKENTRRNEKVDYVNKAFKGRSADWTIEFGKLIDVLYAQEVLTNLYMVACYIK